MRLLLCTLIFSVGALADDAADRQSLSGTWQESSSTWVLQEKGDSIHVSWTENGQPQADFECRVGQECEIKEAGRKAKVSMWFNGPKLVQMETRGNEVVKRRFSANGDEMEMEVIPVTAEGKPQVIKLKRAK